VAHTHIVESTQETVRSGYLDPAAKPVAVIQPGDIVRYPIGWGWNSFPLGVGALPHDFAEAYVHYFTFDDARTVAVYEHGITLPMAPFLGVVATEPAGSRAGTPAARRCAPRSGRSGPPRARPPCI
jgi:acetamidase/formamidase